MEDLDDIGEEVEEVTEETGRRKVLLGVAALAGVGGAGYLLTQGDGTTGSDAKGYIESFEDGALDEYDTTGDGVAIDSERTYHGDGALHLTTGSGSVNAKTTSGLDSLPSAGDTFRYRFYPSPVKGDGGANLTFALQDGGGGYQVICNFWKGYFALKRDDGDTRSTLDKTSVGYDGGRWYTVEIDWGQGEISLTLADERDGQRAQLSATDETYSSGGLSLTAWANSYRLNVFYDAIEFV